MKKFYRNVDSILIVVFMFINMFYIVFEEFFFFFNKKKKKKKEIGKTSYDGNLLDIETNFSFKFCKLYS